MEAKIYFWSPGLFLCSCFHLGENYLCSSPFNSMNWGKANFGIRLNINLPGSSTHIRFLTINSLLLSLIYQCSLPTADLIYMLLSFGSKIIFFFFLLFSHSANTHLCPVVFFADSSMTNVMKEKQTAEKIK